MAQITVLRPDVAEPAAARLLLARRASVPAGSVVTIIENGKPRARELLTLLAEELSRRLPLGRIDVHTKPSAAKPIDADAARMLAARSRLVITGLGD